MDAWAAPRRAGIVGAYASHIRGLTALGQADFETAFHNAAAISPPGVLAPYAPHALWVFHDLVEAAIHTGRDAEAAAHVAAARDCRLDRLSPRLRLVVLASAAITEPRTDTAALEQAITEPGNDRWPFDLARIQLAYGSHLRRSSERPTPAASSAGAAEIFQRLGATPWAARADRELRATGITVAKADTGLGLPHPAATPDRPAGGGGPHQQRDRRPALPLPENGLHPPVPGLPQARHHLEGRPRDALADIPPE